MSAFCSVCGDPLTPEERRYYENRCNACEGEWLERITRWRKGDDDPELDDLFSFDPDEQGVEAPSYLRDQTRH